ncbi:calnexin [Scaptodrosophila lebanonensis]|uniref:Calnexin n=1 Tax=Drosophila lebanonensis TaxID=7225 RepID=A0A6J2T9F8_DROLE|nr:calnexin [Scaptodrosophila lebanonensis]
MQLKFGRSETLAFLLSCSLLAGGGFVQLTTASDVDDFDDGIVEDIQDDGATVAAGDAELVYESPQIDAKKFHFADHFDNVEASRKLWTQSQAKKDDIAEEIAKYDGVWNWESPQRIVWAKDKGLVLKSKAKHAAISARLHKQFTFKENKPLVVQYEVTLQEGQECGGSYIKLLSAGSQTEDLTTFNDKTPYTIMFGPDKCGNDIKMHFIFRHVNPINGTISEKHCNKPKNRLEEPFKDKLPHLYQLVVRPDNTFEIRLDHKIINDGSLLTDFKPPVNPPQEIDDPNDIKPADWDEREKIPDPTAQKPDDWDDDAPPQIPDPTAVMPDTWLEDEPEMIPNPTAQKPDDWDAEIDGEWEAPLVDNPACEKAAGCGKWKAPLIPNQEYKGKWRAPMIDNPNYQGKWAPRKIPNPDFYEDLKPFEMTPINAVGLELWSMSSDILFDNLIITDDVDVAREFAANSFDIKRKYIDRESDSLVNKVLEFSKTYPTAWAIGLVATVALVVIVIYFKFGKSKKPVQDTTSSADADPKKTDAPQPDDERVEDEIDDAEKSVDNAAGEPIATQEASKESSPLSASPKKKKKSDLDIKDDVTASKNDEIGDEPTQTEETTTKSTRKRQVRKD